MEQIRSLAYVSVRRACAFAGLGILTFMMGLSFDPALAARCGAMFTSVLTLFLVYRGSHALRFPYRHTEVWIMLDKPKAMPAEVAQKVIGTALQESYLAHAELAAGIAVFLWITFVIALAVS